MNHFKKKKPQISLEGLIAKQALTFFEHMPQTSEMERDMQ